MHYDEFDHLMSGLSSLATVVALAIGGAWAYRRFIRTREACPKIEFTVDAGFVHKQNGFWIIELLACIENKGLVQHRISQFTFRLRYTLASDPVVGQSAFLVDVPHVAARGSWLPEGWQSTFVEPGIRTRYSCLAAVPDDATTVLIHGKFYYDDETWHTAERLLACPASSPPGE